MCIELFPKYCRAFKTGNLTLNFTEADDVLLFNNVIDAWTEVTGATVERYTGEKFIKNQTLFVKINNPSLRQDLSMMRTQLVKRLNESVGSFVISEVKIY